MPKLKEAEAPVAKVEVLSDQAQKFLKQQGYSTQFIRYVGQMLTEASNKNHDADMQSHSFTSRIKPQKTGPIEMPKKLDGLTTESPADAFYGSKNTPIMPNIGLYSPTSSYTKDVYDAFKSREGQRFMKKEYNWIVKDPKTGEWMINKPESKLAGVIPKRI